MVALKGALELSDADVAEALRERAQRIYDKFGAPSGCAARAH
jgi:hypothetical protein